MVGVCKPCSSGVMRGGYWPVLLRKPDIARSLVRVGTKNAWQNLGLAALAAVVLAGAVALLAGWPPQPPPSHLANAKFQPKVAPVGPVQDDIVFVGDSYTSAQDMPGGEGYADMTADELDMEATILADWGAGYLTKGDQGETIRSLIEARTVDRSVDVAVIAAGYNDYDHGWTLKQIRAAAADTFRLAERTWPTAQVVVVGPWSISDPTPQVRIVLRDALRAEARDAGLPFVNTYPWVSDIERGKDGVHPTLAGHEALAAHVTRALKPLV